MGCSKHGINNCTACNSCGSSIVMHVTRSQNNSIGRDGEDAYEAYIREGGTLSKKDWALSIDKNSYTVFEWK